MTRLEDALRATFDAEVDAHTAQALEGVRRGARRRRTRRNAAVAVAAVSVMVAGIAVGGSLVGRGDGAPEPAPSPSETSVPEAAIAPPAAVTAVEAGPDGSVLVAANDPDCACTVLYRRDDRWHRVHEFPVEWVELAMAPDGRNGWAAATGVDRRVWATHDGGASWSMVEVPLDAPEGPGNSFTPAVTSEHVWLVNSSGSLWRAPLTGGDFEPAPSSPGGVSRIFAVGDAVVVTAVPEGSTGAVERYSRDSGESWADLSAPCNGEYQLLGSDVAAFVICGSETSGTTYLRSQDLRQWEGFGSPSGALSNEVPIAADLLLLQDGDDLLLTEEGPVRVDTGLPGEASAWDAVVVQDRIYLATTGGVLLSDDEGRAWRHAD